MCYHCQHEASEGERLAVAKARAEAGATWLDEVEPGWANRIDLSLDMANNCVIVQLYGNWIFRPDHLREYADSELPGFWADLEVGQLSNALLLGFDAYREDPAGVAFSDLNKVWPPLIEQRKSPATVE